MSTIGILIGTIPPLDQLPPADGYISLSPRERLPAQHPGLTSGESAYALSTLTDQADQLAMEWARATYATLAGSDWTALSSYQDLNLKPLVINRLFRGFFLDPARIYLGVQRLIDIERPQRVVLHSPNQTDLLFAESACRELGVEPLTIPAFLPSQHGSLIPEAAHTFLRDIALPASRHLFRTLSPSFARSRMPLIVFLERETVAIEMVADAFSALQSQPGVGITVVRFRPRGLSQPYDGALYREGGDYQSPSNLVRLLSHQARVMAGPKSRLMWRSALLRTLEPHLIRFVRQIALPSIVHTLESVQRIIQVENPDLLVTVDETGLLGKAVATQGRHAQIPTLNVQHGIRRDSPWLEDQAFDRFAVFGPSTAEVFTRRGNDPSMFVSTGAPRYDRLFRQEGMKARRQVAAELGLDPNLPIVVFASQRAWDRMTPVVKRDTLLALLRACQAIPLQLVVKLRSGQNDYVPVEATREQGWDRVTVTADYNLYDLLNAADLVVTAYSTVGLEAVALGKPLLIINLTGQPDPVPYVEEGVAYGAYEADEVAEALRRALAADPEDPHRVRCRKAFIARHLTSDDGRSAQRLAALMLDMMECHQQT